MDEIDDRRGSGRVYIMTSVKLEIAGQTLDATALDLSQTGVSVWAPEGQSAPDTLSITMVMDDKGPMTLSGRVARQFESDGGSVWGIAFDGVQPDQQARLDAYLATL
jgi:c-di-GMP-binding flagellar brake protein YcgR